MANIAKTVSKVLFSPHKKGKTLNNLYTGKRLNPYTVAGVGAIATAAIIADTKGFSDSLKNPMNSFSAVVTSSKRMAVPPQDQREAPAMLADGLTDKTLGAEGSMVLGMHNRRHG